VKVEGGGRGPALHNSEAGWVGDWGGPGGVTTMISLRSSLWKTP
jgi:hypothetical protein